MVSVLKRFVKGLVSGYKIISTRKAFPEGLPSVVVKQMPPVLAKPLEEEFKIEGFEIPKFMPSKVRIEAIKPEEKVPISLEYPLIPKKPAKGKPVFAYTKISWNPKLHKYVYQLIEPKLSKKLENILKKVKELLEQKLDVDFSKLRKFEAVEFLHKSVDDILAHFKIEVTEEERMLLHYYIERNFIGLGKIEPLMRDSEIEDISCDGLGIPLFIFHRNPEISSVITNVVYDKVDELDSFILRLAQLCGKSISVAQPLVGGSLPDGSRLQAALATDIARRGSNFTIRKFTERPLTPVHLLSYNTLDVQILAYLWFLVDYGKSILVSGGTASGKTTTLNVLSLFIRSEKKICSIEDTPELKLPHSHWVPHVARVPISMEGRKKIGEVDLFDLLKESLRYRPDYIVVGEVRGKEAFVLFQEMATGHPSLATIHAENLPKLIDRLTTPPIELPATLLGSLDLILFQLLVRQKETHVRRISEALEIVGINQKTNRPITNRVFKWNATKDKFEIVGKSALLKKISENTGLKEQQIKDELERRMLVLNWMQEKNIIDYRDVFKTLNMYYAYPERVLTAIKGEI